MSTPSPLSSLKPVAGRALEIALAQLLALDPDTRDALQGLDGRRIAGNLARDSADYLVEERREVVGRAELEAFHDDVDALRDRVERLAARVARLDRGDAA